MADAGRLLEPILALHERIRDAVLDACTRQASELLAAVASDAGEGGDTIYAIDRVGEETLVEGLAELARQEPLCLVAEGLPGDGLVLPRGAREPRVLRPSRADTIEHGFATVVRFFPGARDTLAAIDDEVVQALVQPTAGRAACFEDQYASTGGELYELIAGHDRLIADLRPLVQPVRAASGLPPGLCCHPYDLCTALIALESGVIVREPGGAPLDAAFDVTSDVAWVGYANERLRALVEPVLQGALRRRGLLPPG